MALRAIILHGTIVIDGWLIAPLGESAVGAMGLAAALGGSILGVIFAFASALQIRTAQAFGTGDRLFLKSVLASGLGISVVIGLAGLTLIVTLARAVIDVLTVDPLIAQQAWHYLSVFVLVILLESFGQCLSAYFNGCGRTRVPFYAYCLSVPVNVLSSFVLIHGYLGLPAFGVAGAALGSGLAVLVQVIVFAVYWARVDRDLIRIQGWRQGRYIPTLRRHVIFALPIAATFVSANLATHVCMLIYARLDLVAFAALTLIAPWNMVAGQISMQWTQATGILVAQLLGQGASERVLDHFLSIAWRGAFVAAGVVAAVFVLMCLSVGRIYPDLSGETRATLAGFLPILLAIQFPRATNAICGNTLRASGDTIYVMHIFLWSQWAFRVPATAIAVLYFEISAFWILGLILAEELLKAPAFHLRLWQGDWKRRDVTA